MPDRTATPEELLDQWLDALNEPGAAAPPAPAEIAELAGVALDYRRALARNGAAFAPPERNGKMHHAHSIATPNGASWRILAQSKPQKASWSSWLATAAVFALLVGLVGGAAVRTWGLPGASDPANNVAGIAASPGASPAAADLSCVSPGYLPIVRGDTDTGDLAMIGGPDRAIRATDDGVFVPLPDGETRDLPADSFISPDSDVALAVHDDNSATVTRISTGETWEYPAVTPRLEDQSWDFFSNGRYVIGPADDSRTDWLITDTLTGDTRATADILGEPFEGPLDPLVETSSENGELWIVRFAQVFFSDRGETPPAQQVDAPGYLIIPDSLDDAWFSDKPVSDRGFDTVASPEGTSFIATQTVRDAKTGERLDSGDDNLTFFGDLIGYLDESTLLTYRDDVINTVDIHTGATTPVFTAPDVIESVGWDRDALMVVIVTASGADASWTRFDLATGEATPLPALDGYAFTPYHVPGYVMGSRYDLGTPGQGSVNTEVLVGIASGTIVATNIEQTVDSTGAWSYEQVALGDRYVAELVVENGEIQVTDRSEGSSWTMALPEPGDPSSALANLDEGTYHTRITLSPDETCLVLNVEREIGREGNAIFGVIATEHVATWIVQLEPDAAWTELPFELDGWWKVPTDESQTLPAQDFATPAASSETTALSCASPGYVPVVSGDPDAPDFAAFGGPGNVIHATDDGVTVPLPGGGTRELPPDSFIYPGSDFALAVHDDNSATATRISTGETWEYPAVEPRVEEQNWDFFANGRYVIGPTDDSRTDWLITDTLTGDTRSTADILGEPFEGPLDLWVTSSSENGDFWLLQFMTLTFTDYDETPPAVVDAPGYIVIPGSLDVAWVADDPTPPAEPIDTVVSPEGTSYIVVQTVRDAKTGERLDTGEDNLTFFGDLIGYLDEDTLLTWRHDTLNTVDIHTAVATPVYTAPDIIQAVAWDRDAGMLAVGSGAVEMSDWTLVDLATGETTPLPDLDGYQLANTSMFGPVSRVNGAAAFIDPLDNRDIHVRSLDMRSGTVSPAFTTRTDSRVSGLESRVPAWSEGRYVRTTDAVGTTTFIDATSGTAVTLPLPAGVSVPDDGRLDISVVPNGTCATLTPLGSDNTPVGNTWIAPIEPGATWTEFPFTIEQWIEVDALTATDPAPTDDTQTLPAQDFATPSAPLESTSLSCASLGYRAVVRGPVDDASLALLGPDPIVQGDTTTITAANGTEIEFGPDMIWTIHWDGSVILSGESGHALNTVTSLATGQSWTFPVLVEDSPDAQPAFMLLGGPWLIGASDVSSTDWRIVNTDTGQERLTSDIFGSPFGQAPLPLVAPWLDPTETPRMIAFSGDSPTPSVVLPSADLADAWALPPPHALASGTGAITSDGSQIAYVRTSPNDGPSTVTVLDGFSGEEIATWPGPETGDVLRTVGLTSDDTKLVLRDNQQVWTVDLATGEITTVFAPGGDIHDFTFDPTTGTALASAGDDAFFWVDPATGEAKPLDIPLPMRFPQVQFGWALIQKRDDLAVDYALLDMTTGELAAEPIAAVRDENGTNVWITGGDDTGVYVIQAESGRMLVLDGPGGRSFDLATPETGRSRWNGIAIGVSPNGGCLVYTEVGQGDEPGTSWIAPLAPDAEWTELPFELGPWIEMPPAPPATPTAIPAAFTPDYQVSGALQINLRAEPTTASRIVETLSPGTPLDYLDEDAPTQNPSDGDRWMKLATEDGRTGWIREIDLKPYEAEPMAGGVAMLPDNAIPVVATDDPNAVDQEVFGTVSGVGPDAPPGITIPLPSGEPLELPDAIAITELPRIAAALVTNDDGSRQTVSLTSGEILVDYLPSYVEGEQWVGHYLLIPGRDGTIWRLIDILTGDDTDTATLGGGPFDRGVMVVPMPSPIDAPRNVVVQFAFETSPGGLMPWQGLATDVGPPSGTLIIPGSLDDARFLDTTRYATIDTVDLMRPTIALSGGDRPLLAQVTRLANGRIVIEDAITGTSVASWETFRAPEGTDVTIAGFGPDGTSLVAWLTGVAEGLPDQVIWMHWDGHPAQATDIDIEIGRIQQVIPALGQYAFVSIVAEPEAGVGPQWRWTLLDLGSGEMTDLPDLDGMVLHRYLPGDPWMIFNEIDDPRSASIVIVDAATGEVAARLDDADLGVATARSSSHDGGVLVVTGHTGDVHTTGYVIDAASGESWALDPPFDGQVWYGVSPDGSLLTASTDAGDGWIAPITPDAAWTPLPGGRIVDWLALPEDG